MVKTPTKTANNGGKGKKEAIAASLQTPSVTVGKERIQLLPLVTDRLEATVRGPILYVSKMDNLTLENIDRKREGLPPLPDKRTHEQRAHDRLHIAEDGKTYVFPTVAFKLGMKDVVSSRSNIVSGMYGREILGFIYMLDRYAPIDYKEMVLKRDVGTDKNHVPMSIYRYAFLDWSIRLRMNIVTACLPIETVCILLNWAGIYRGVGPWSVRHGGDAGTYNIDPNSIDITREKT